MKSLKKIAFILIVCIAGVIFAGCDNLGNYVDSITNGVDVKIINDTEYNCDIAYTDFVEASSEDSKSSEEYGTKINLSGNGATVILNVEPSTRIKFTVNQGSYRSGTRRISYEAVTLKVSEMTK